MSKIERAIIMAAGMGSRMNPVTLDIPKPLVMVNGVRMIDTIISALLENNIYEIYIVIGHLKECFGDIRQQYPSVELIENPYYKTCNNISSLYVSRKHLKNVIILDGDQLIQNPKILFTDFKYSGYHAIWTNSYTSEWLLDVDKGHIVSCNRNGGKRGWRLCSVSRWNVTDGERLRNHVELEFEEKQNCSIFWDDIVLFCYPDEYNLGIFKTKENDIFEIDSLAELAKLDKSYQSISREET